MKDTILGCLFAAAGVFAVCGAIFQWAFFMNHRKAQFLIRLIGIQGTRIFYAVLGTALSVLGVLIAFGIVKN